MCSGQNFITTQFLQQKAARELAHYFMINVMICIARRLYVEPPCQHTGMSIYMSIGVVFIMWLQRRRAATAAAVLPLMRLLYQLLLLHPAVSVALSRLHLVVAH